jgi:hypothetical protein
VPTPIKGPEREEQLRIEDVGELAQSRGWDPDDIEDPDEKAHANSCERSTRGHNLGPNDPHLQHNEEQENDEDREGGGGEFRGRWRHRRPMAVHYERMLGAKRWPAIDAP